MKRRSQRAKSCQVQCQLEHREKADHAPDRKESERKRGAEWILAVMRTSAYQRIFLFE